MSEDDVPEANRSLNLTRELFLVYLNVNTGNYVHCEAGLIACRSSPFAILT